MRLDGLDKYQLLPPKGKRSATGTQTAISITGGYSLQVTGLPFKPSKVILSFYHLDGSYSYNYLHLFGFNLNRSGDPLSFNDTTLVGVAATNGAGTAPRYYTATTAVLEGGFTSTLAFSSGSIQWHAFE